MGEEFDESLNRLDIANITHDQAKGPHGHQIAVISVLRSLEWRGAGAEWPHARNDSDAYRDRGRGSHKGCLSRIDHQIGHIFDGHQMAAWPARLPRQSTVA
ncbi:hypothetical protein T492DRAFT_882372 [Pavlovales sp. CCMP2436]|nr:hypothetical protein T492DRAFT_882372 [Pavlovales sp. CCMP2436]